MLVSHLHVTIPLGLKQMFRSSYDFKNYQEFSVDSMFLLFATIQHLAENAV
jgi:hypothetical protein